MDIKAKSSRADYQEHKRNPADGADIQEISTATAHRVINQKTKVLSPNLLEDGSVNQNVKGSYKLQSRSIKSLQSWIRGLRSLTSTNAKLPATLPPVGFVSLKKPQEASEFELPPSFGPTMLMQAVASASACAGKLSSQVDDPGPSTYFDAKLVELLLRRDSPKTESFTDLSAAPVERALDSILADEVIGHMPAVFISPIADLGRVCATLMGQVEPGRKRAWTRNVCEELKREHPQAWSVKTPITALLCDDNQSDEEKSCAVVQFLGRRPRDGFETMAAMAILRAVYISADRLGIAGQTVPFISRATNFYVSNMLHLTGRIYVQWGPQGPKHQGAGLTAYNQPSPIDASWMQPARISSHLYRPNPESRHIVRDLAYGNPYGVGISGSASMFLFAASYFNEIGATNIDLMALTTSMATMLCYDGGHSFNEVYLAAQMFPGAASTPLSQLRDYHPGHARGLFIDQADPQQSWLATSGFRRLAKFLLDKNE